MFVKGLLNIPQTHHWVANCNLITTNWDFDFSLFSPRNFTLNCFLFWFLVFRSYHEVKTPVSDFEFRRSPTTSPSRYLGERSLSYPEKVGNFSKSCHMPLSEGIAFRKDVWFYLPQDKHMERWTFLLDGRLNVSKWSLPS